MTQLKHIIILFTFIYMTHATIVHITDIHYDGYYIEGSSELEHCHRSGILPHAGKYGSHFCDAPISIEETLGRFIRNEPHLAVPDAVLWGGDAVRHGSDSKLPVSEEEHWISQQQVAKWLGNWWPNTTVIVTIGNNDVYPHDELDAGPNEVLSNITNAFSQFLDTSQRATFMKGGYYHSPGFISLNSLYFATFNKRMSDIQCSEHSPGFEQLIWLNETLKECQDKGENVIIVSHVPPNEGKNWYSSCYTLYRDITSAYPDLIQAHIYGHTHDDDFEIIRGADSAPTGVIFVSPSVVPEFNSGIRAYSADMTSYVQYFAPLHRDKCDYVVEYGSMSAYDVADLRPSTWAKLQKEIRDDPVSKKAILYEKYKYVSIL